MSIFRKLCTLAFALLIVSTTALAIAPRPAAAQELSPGCRFLNNSALDGDNIWVKTAVFEFWAGDTITIVASGAGSSSLPAAPRLAQTFLLRLEMPVGTMVDEEPFPGTLRYVVPANIMADVWWGNSAEQHVWWEVSCTSAGSPEEPSTIGVPGCDALIAIPPTAVVGAFVADAQVYWKPDALTNPVITISAGKTAWVLGQDASGMYNKIIWSCSLVWVPKNTMGPNPDAVWMGKPLPADVVK